MNRYYSVRIIFHNTILGLPGWAGIKSLVKPEKTVRDVEEIDYTISLSIII